MSDLPPDAPPFVDPAAAPPVDNPPYLVPYGHADAPPPIPLGDPNLDPAAVSYVNAFIAPPDPRDPVTSTQSEDPNAPGGLLGPGAHTGPDLQDDASDYINAFVKPPDPRDPPTSVLTPGELIPPSPTTPPAELDTTGQPLDPPVNVDVPHLSQNGAVLQCTMGNWEGEPDSYTYLWIADGLEVGPGAETYDLVTDDVGRSYACVVTATNVAGSTDAPASNAVTVETLP